MPRGLKCPKCRGYGAWLAYDFNPKDPMEMRKQKVHSCGYAGRWRHAWTKGQRVGETAHA